uniref:Replication protein n=1 Tax=Actinobacillus pleuropneumoniae TaxID=715 RepID=B3GPN8_ACTPL|nr:replication initiation protein [Actinobacillus pleuropneumoniae]ACD76092.1 replication protein [Actinobacillus pleuropneumoniae]
MAVLKHVQRRELPKVPKLPQFFDDLVNMPFWTNEKGSIFVPSRIKAFKHGFIRHTHHYVSKWLIVDIDDFDGDYSVFEKFDLTPNYLIRNPKKQKSLQVGYVLATPVFKLEDKDFFDYRKLDKNGEPLPLDNQSKQIKFIETVIRLNELFNGDTNFKLHNAKNPFFATEVGAVAWTELPPYSVDELFNRAFADRYNPKFADVDFTDIENHILTEVEPNEHYKYDENSRNCQLFDEMRYLPMKSALNMVETKATKEFFTYLFNVANSKNREIGLPENEVKAMIRSIVKYCFRNELVCKYPSYQQLASIGAKAVRAKGRTCDVKPQLGIEL